MGNGRVDVGEFITLTINPGYIVSLTSFSLTGFGSASLLEQATYAIDGGGAITLNAPATNVARDFYLVNQSVTSNIVFGSANGNYSLARVTLDIDQRATPEPATLGLMGVALVGVFFGRRRYASTSGRQK